MREISWEHLLLLRAMICEPQTFPFIQGLSTAKYPPQQVVITPFPSTRLFYFIYLLNFYPIFLLKSALKVANKTAPT